MTQTEALKSAIEFAEYCLEELDLSYMASNQAKRLVDKVKEALAQPEQEPACCNGNCPNTKDCEQAMQCLYTTPPKRTWVGLTDEERKNIFLKWYGKHWAYTDQVQSVMNSVEAKLKEKNT